MSLLLEREQPVVLDTSTPSTLERQMCSSLSSSFSTLPGRDVPMDTTFSSRPKDYSFVSDGKEHCLCVCVCVPMCVCVCVCERERVCEGARACGRTLSSLVIY